MTIQAGVDRPGHPKSEASANVHGSTHGRVSSPSRCGGVTPERQGLALGTRLKNAS